MEENFGLPTTIDKIVAEAHQRKMEILLLGDQEGAALKKKFVSIAKEKVDEQFNIRKKKQLALRRIARSEAINSHRMRKIRKKYDLCEKIFHEVELRLQLLANQPENKDQYKLYLIQTIVDGLVRMFEDEIHIRCLEKDKNLFEQIIPLCVKSYQEYMDEQIGIQYQIALSIAKNMKLQQRSLIDFKSVEKAEEDKKCIGGVILADNSGNITFKATFDSRLSILKEICLPDIRSVLWGENKNVEI